MSWFYLILAILLETFGTTSLKLSNGFTVLFPSLGAIISYGLCFLFLSYALKAKTDLEYICVQAKSNSLEQFGLGDAELC